jgi:hypothetical protein
MDTIIESVHIKNNCCICLDSVTDTSYPKYCDCKIEMHKECLELVELNGLKCPICRIKKIKKIITNIYPSIFDTNKYILERIISIPFWLFEIYPSIITFSIMILYSFIIAIIILPIVSYSLNIKKN